MMIFMVVVVFHMCMCNQKRRSTTEATEETQLTDRNPSNRRALTEQTSIHSHFMTSTHLKGQEPEMSKLDDSFT
jgi:hypothetical protein